MFMHLGDTKRRSRAPELATRTAPTRLILCASLALAALCAPAFAQSSADAPYWLDRPVIEAIGRARTEQPTNEARFSVTFEETAREAGDASVRAADRARLTTAAIRQRGGDAIEVRSNVQVAAIYEQYVDQSGARRENTAADRVRNYVSRVRLDVRVRDASRISDVMAAALATGPEGATEPVFMLRDTMEAHRDVFALAARDAAERAQSAAAATGARLGALLALQEGQGPCMGRSAASGYGGPIPVMLEATQSPLSADVSVQGERQVLTLTGRQIERLRLPNDPPTVTMEAFVCAVYAVDQ
jgi:uncharacterized protein YggE